MKSNGSEGHGAVAVDSLIEKKSPGDGAKFWSLSSTWTSKRHNGVVVLHVVGNNAGDPDVSR